MICLYIYIFSEKLRLRLIILKNFATVAFLLNTADVSAYLESCVLKLAIQRIKVSKNLDR